MVLFGFWSWHFFSFFILVQNVPLGVLSIAFIRAVVVGGGAGVFVSLHIPVQISHLDALSAAFNLALGHRVLNDNLALRCRPFFSRDKYMSTDDLDLCHFVF